MIKDEFTNIYQYLPIFTVFKKRLNLKLCYCSECDLNQLSRNRENTHTHTDTGKGRRNKSTKNKTA